MKYLQQFCEKKLQFLHRLRKGNVSQFVCCQAEKRSRSTNVLVLPDANRQEHISGKHKGALGAHCIIRKDLHSPVRRSTDLLILRRQQAGIDRQKGNTVRPAQGQHPETVGETMTGVVVDLGQKLHFFEPFCSKTVSSKTNAFLRFSLS